MCHIITDKSPAFQPLMRGMEDLDINVRKKANDQNEHNAIKLACELGFHKVTKQYLIHVSSVYPEDTTNAKCMSIVDHYC